MNEQEIKQLQEIRDRALSTSKKIVEFIRNNPPSYKIKVEEAPKHIGYES